MSTTRAVRLTAGALIILGLLLWTPLAWFVGIMLIIGGLTGKCLLEKVFIKCGCKGTCDISK